MNQTIAQIQSETQSEKPSLWEKVKGSWQSMRRNKYLRLFAAGIFAFHLGTETNYYWNLRQQDLHPTKQQVRFRQEFGFPIYGEASELENKSLSSIVEIIHNERQSGPISLKSLHLIPRSYRQKSFFQQLFAIQNCMSKTSTCAYIPYTNTIVLDPDIKNLALCHELKHAREAALPQRTQFLEEWAACSQNQDGSSPYLSWLEWWAYKIGLCQKALQEEKEPEKEGFVSSYSRISAQEDIAEINALAEENPLGFIHAFYQQHNPRIIKKVLLSAQQSQLIPKEFPVYLELENLYRTTQQVHRWEPVSEAEKKRWLFLSNLFLATFPRSKYLGEIYCSRGTILEAAGEIEQAAISYKNGLASPYNDPSTYRSLLGRLRRCSKNLGQNEKEQLYISATDLYMEKAKEDPFISVTGINEYLRARGGL